MHSCSCPRPLVSPGAQHCSHCGLCSSGATASLVRGPQEPFNARAGAAGSETEPLEWVDSSRVTLLICNSWTISPRYYLPVSVIIASSHSGGQASVQKLYRKAPGAQSFTGSETIRSACSGAQWASSPVEVMADLRDTHYFLKYHYMYQVHYFIPYICIFICSRLSRW